MRQGGSGSKGGVIFYKYLFYNEFISSAIIKSSLFCTVTVTVDAFRRCSTFTTYSIDGIFH